MNSLDSVWDVVARQVKARFGDYPVVVQESPEDPDSLWVQVFAVPEAQEFAVTDLILDLQDRVSPDCSVLLLPMVKTLEVTQRYYPQYAQTDSIQATETFFRFRLDRQPKGYVIASGVHTTNLLSDSDLYDLDRLYDGWVCGRLKPLRPAEKLSAVTRKRAKATEKLTTAA